VAVLLDHTQLHTYTHILGGTPLDEGSARLSAQLTTRAKSKQSYAAGRTQFDVTAGNDSCIESVFKWATHYGSNKTTEILNCACRWQIFSCGDAFLVLRSAAFLYRELRREIETLYVRCDNVACVLSVNVVQKTACGFQARSADLTRNDPADFNSCFVDCWHGMEMWETSDILFKWYSVEVIFC